MGNDARIDEEGLPGADPAEPTDPTEASEPTEPTEPERPSAEAGSAADPSGSAGSAAENEAEAEDADVFDEIDTVSELEASHRELNDRFLRLAAEFDNFRRRANQERSEAWARAQADLVGKLIDTLDDLQRVSDLDPDTATAPSILEGVEMVERKFLRTLLDAGIEELNPEGVRFDPNVMEAVMRATTDDPEMDDQVASVFQRGYTFKGLLVRPARVSVYKAG